MSESQFRRASDREGIRDSKVRAEILEQMSEVEDMGVRVMLSLMLRMQDETNTYFSTLQGHMIQIHGELSKLQKTDDQIKSMVLNGHTDTHHDDHELISEVRKHYHVCQKVMTSHDKDGLCEHARQAIEDAKVAKVRRWKIVDGLSEKAAWLVLMFFAGLAGAKLFPGVFQ